MRKEKKTWINIKLIDLSHKEKKTSDLFKQLYKQRRRIKNV